MFPIDPATLPCRGMGRGGQQQPQCGSHCACADSAGAHGAGANRQRQDLRQHGAPQGQGFDELLENYLWIVKRQKIEII